MPLYIYCIHIYFFKFNVVYFLSLVLNYHVSSLIYYILVTCLIQSLALDTREKYTLAPFLQTVASSSTQDAMPIIVPFLMRPLPLSPWKHTI